MGGLCQAGAGDEDDGWVGGHLWDWRYGWRFGRVAGSGGVFLVYGIREEGSK